MKFLGWLKTDEIHSANWQLGPGNIIGDLEIIFELAGQPLFTSLNQKLTSDILHEYTFFIQET